MGEKEETGKGNPLPFPAGFEGERERRMFTLQITVIL